VYEVITDGSGPGERFEVVQKMTDPPLAEQPETGEPVKRVILPPRIAGRLSPMKTERALSGDKKLERLGFAEYAKSDAGGYGKVAGSGPDLI